MYVYIYICIYIYICNLCIYVSLQDPACPSLKWTRSGFIDRPSHARAPEEEASQQPERQQSGCIKDVS